MSGSRRTPDVNLLALRFAANFAAPAAPLCTLLNRRQSRDVKDLTDALEEGSDTPETVGALRARRSRRGGAAAHPVAGRLREFPPALGETTQGKGACGR